MKPVKIYVCSEGHDNCNRSFSSHFHPHLNLHSQQCKGTLQPAVMLSDIENLIKERIAKGKIGLSKPMERQVMFLEVINQGVLFEIINELESLLSALGGGEG